MIHKIERYISKSTQASALETIKTKSSEIARNYSGEVATGKNHYTTTYQEMLYVLVLVYNKEETSSQAL